MTDEKPDTGLTSWQYPTNHNRIIELQQKFWQDSSAAKSTDHSEDSAGNIELAFFGSSAFRITTAAGLTIMLDPWRNHPSRKWDWYFKDFPKTAVDIGVSTHAHFDHDALHRLDASIMLDRLVGQFSLCDVVISGIADKHATDSTAALYDFKNIILEFDGIDITPPDNPRSWDNCLITVESAGLRILHWGDNRHNPPDNVWQALGEIDVLLLPVDNTQHVLGYESLEQIIARAKPKMVVPHHYYIRDVVQRQSTLQKATDWIGKHSERVIATGKSTFTLNKTATDKIKTDDWEILYFGDHVCFDTHSWRNSG